MIFKGDEAKGELNGFLDAGSHIQGELHFEDTFRIDGKVTGKIQSAGDLVVGEKGEVDGEIYVGRLFVSGSVKGSA
jgi:cytoskeletal protein CcmA (bactofilin family)